MSDRCQEIISHPKTFTLKDLKSCSAVCPIIRSMEKGCHTSTEVYVAYDSGNLYFTLHCLDSEPEKIRTTISRRDSIFNDDWAGLSLDSAGTGQTSYHLLINPSGVQMDALNTSASGERWEADLVWDSAGATTSDGYNVEEFPGAA